MIKIILNGPGVAFCLVKVQRKVRQAIETAQAAKRLFSACYPDSVGPDTSVPHRNEAIVLHPWQAAELASGKTVHHTLGARPVKRRILNRVPAVQRLRSLHLEAA